MCFTGLQQEAKQKEVQDKKSLIKGKLKEHLFSDSLLWCVMI